MAEYPVPPRPIPLNQQVQLIMGDESKAQAATVMSTDDHLAHTSSDQSVAGVVKQSSPKCDVAFHSTLQPLKQLGTLFPSASDRKNPYEVNKQEGRTEDATTSKLAKKTVAGDADVEPNDQSKQGYKNKNQSSAYHNYQSSKMTAPNAKIAAYDLEVTKIAFRKMYYVMEELFTQLLMRYLPSNFTFLDIGAAPGGASQFLLDRSPMSCGYGFTLPPEWGGFPMGLKNCFGRYQLHLGDLLADPDKVDLVRCQRAVHLCFADAQLLKQSAGFVNGNVRSEQEARTCLITSQVLNGLTNLKENGLFAIRLYAYGSEMCKNETQLIFLLMHYFYDVRPWKSAQFHASDLSFYLVCSGFKRQQFAKDKMFGKLESSYKKYYRLCTNRKLLKLRDEYLWRTQMMNHGGAAPAARAAFSGHSKDEQVAVAGSSSTSTTFTSSQQGSLKKISAVVKDPTTSGTAGSGDLLQSVTAAAQPGLLVDLKNVSDQEQLARTISRDSSDAKTLVSVNQTVLIDHSTEELVSQDGNPTGTAERQELNNGCSNLDARELQSHDHVNAEHMMDLDVDSSDSAGLSENDDDEELHEDELMNHYNMNPEDINHSFPAQEFIMQEEQKEMQQKDEQNTTNDPKLPVGHVVGGNEEGEQHQDQDHILATPTKKEKKLLLLMRPRTYSSPDILCQDYERDFDMADHGKALVEQDEIVEFENHNTTTGKKIIMMTDEPAPAVLVPETTVKTAEQDLCAAAHPVVGTSSYQKENEISEEFCRGDEEVVADVDDHADVSSAAELQNIMEMKSRLLVANAKTTEENQNATQNATVDEESRSFEDREHDRSFASPTPQRPIRLQFADSMSSSTNSLGEADRLPDPTKSMFEDFETLKQLDRCGTASTELIPCSETSTDDQSPEFAATSSTTGTFMDINEVCRNMGISEDEFWTLAGIPNPDMQAVVGPQRGPVPMELDGDIVLTDELLQHQPHNFTIDHTKEVDLDVDHANMSQIMQNRYGAGAGAAAAPAGRVEDQEIFNQSQQGESDEGFLQANQERRILLNYDEAENCRQHEDPQNDAGAAVPAEEEQIVQQNDDSWDVAWYGHVTNAHTFFNKIPVARTSASTSSSNAINRVITTGSTAVDQHQVSGHSDVDMVTAAVRPVGTNLFNNISSPSGRAAAVAGGLQGQFQQHGINQGLSEPTLSSVLNRPVVMTKSKPKPTFASGAASPQPTQHSSSTNDGSAITVPTVMNKKPLLYNPALQKKMPNSSHQNHVVSIGRSSFRLSSALYEKYRPEPQLLVQHAPRYKQSQEERYLQQLENVIAYVLKFAQAHTRHGGRTVARDTSVGHDVSADVESGSTEDASRVVKKKMHSESSSDQQPASSAGPNCSDEME
ncbi:unnamed protein product [Amoebophrya sp. A120]|nr:unnamed protein product [Amoebophrya sp. A120]|eukprot:GSA120T00004364001.1